MSLIVLLVAATIATALAVLLPAFRGVLPLTIVVAVVSATAVSAVSLRRKSAPLWRLSIAAYGYFCGALIATLGQAHLVAVLGASIGRVRRGEFAYGFHFYSLVLLGILLVVGGALATVQAPKLARGEVEAWRASMVVCAALLAINLPLVPLQGFAILFSVLVALNLVLLRVARRSFSGRSEALASGKSMEG